jgi:hypothetical protein
VTGDRWQEKPEAENQEREKRSLFLSPFLPFLSPITCSYISCHLFRVTSVTFYPGPLRTKLYSCPLSLESARSFALSASSRKRVAIAKSSVSTASRNLRCGFAPTACFIAKPVARRAITNRRTDRHRLSLTLFTQYLWRQSVRREIQRPKPRPTLQYHVRIRFYRACVAASSIRAATSFGCET